MDGVSGAEAGHGDGVVTKVSTRTVAETVARFTGIAKAKGLRVFAVIDQAAEARQAGLELRDTVLVVFGNPAAGTPVMAAAPLSALDLPLKFAVWDDAGQTKVSYVSPETIAARYGLDAALAANLAAIGPLTDALVAPRDLKCSCPPSGPDGQPRHLLGISPGGVRVL